MGGEGFAVPVVPIFSGCSSWVGWVAVGDAGAVGLEEVSVEVVDLEAVSAVSAGVEAVPAGEHPEVGEGTFYGAPHYNIL